MRQTDTMLRGAARGAIAAMAMSGLRRVTTTLGMVEETPPESILQRGAPGLFYRIPVQQRPVLVEVVHWSDGAASWSQRRPGRTATEPTS